MIKKYLQLLFLCLLASSCDKQDANSDPIVINIPVDFNIDLWEELDGSPRNDVLVKIETTKVYDCNNYIIDSRLEIENGVFIITLEEIFEPADCESEMGTAKAFIELSELESGSYPIFFNLKSTVSNAGMLTVNDSKYRIEMESMDGIELIHQDLYRIPDAFIWGYISYEGEANQTIVDDFFSEIENIATLSSLNQGNYGYFSISENMELLLGENTPLDHTETFFYHFEGQEEELEQVIANWKGDNSVELKIYNSAGKEF